MLAQVLLPPSIVDGSDRRIELRLSLRHRLDCFNSTPVVVLSLQRATGHTRPRLEATAEALQSEEAALTSGGLCSADA